MACATCSLPDPLSSVMSTLSRSRATFAMRSSMAVNTGDWPTHRQRSLFVMRRPGSCADLECGLTKGPRENRTRGRIERGHARVFHGGLSVRLRGADSRPLDFPTLARNFKLNALQQKPTARHRKRHRFTGTDQNAKALITLERGTTCAFL